MSRCSHFSCPKMPDRLLYQSEAWQLLPERGLVVVEPEVPFSVLAGTSGTQGNPAVAVELKAARLIAYPLTQTLRVAYKPN